MRDYKVFSNWDFSGMGTILTPESPKKELPLTKEHIQLFIKDAADSAVDAFLCCPTILRAPVWNSKARPYWDTPLSDFEEPENDDECTSSQRTMKRVRKYIKSGGRPIEETYEAVKKYGMDFFFSLRMNDWHNMAELTPENRQNFPTLDSFYTDHPEYRIGKDNPANNVGWHKMHPLMQDYMRPEVRKHYLALIDELIALCPVDGFELDFMRCFNYFKPEDIEAGTAVMTDFIRAVRGKLDAEGEKRGVFLPLCLRMPQFYDVCAPLGFDLATLCGEGTVQIVTVSSSYIESLNLEIEKFKEKLPKAKIFGEIQAMAAGKVPVSDSDTIPFGYCVERRMTDEMYRAAAFALWQRGADGITLFNFQFRRPLTLAGWKEAANPDVSQEVLKVLADRDTLAAGDKHYFVSGNSNTSYDGSLPAKDRAEVLLRLYENDFSAYASARLRVITILSDISNTPADVRMNGVPLAETENGELFPAPVNEGLVRDCQAKNFTVPLHALRQDSTVSISLPGAQIYLVELGLYAKK